MVEPKNVKYSFPISKLQKENEYHNVSKFILSIPFKEDKETEIKPEKERKQEADSAKSKPMMSRRDPVNKTPNVGGGQKTAGLRSTSSRPGEAFSNKLKNQNYMQATSAWTKKVEQQNQHLEDFRRLKQEEQKKNIAAQNAQLLGKDQNLSNSSLNFNTAAVNDSQNNRNNSRHAA